MAGTALFKVAQGGNVGIGYVQNGLPGTSDRREPVPFQKANSIHTRFPGAALQRQVIDIQVGKGLKEASSEPLSPRHELHVNAHIQGMRMKRVGPCGPEANGVAPLFGNDGPDEARTVGR
jgi:hypothetical protein